MNDTKTVKVSKDTHTRLGYLGVKGETYGAIIARLIDPRKEKCRKHNHLYDRLSVDCSSCSAMRMCWAYSGYAKSYISEDSYMEDLERIRAQRSEEVPR